MEEVGFAELEAHKAEHQKMKKQLDALHAQFTIDDPASIRELLSFLNNWWLRHITEEDTKYNR